MSRNRFVSRWSLLIVSALAFAIGAWGQPLVTAVHDGMIASVAAQDPVTQPPQQDPADTGRGRGGQTQGPRPYAQVVTGAFKTDDGIFKVHRGMVSGTDSVLFEIPTAQLDKDFVWNVHIKKTTIGVGFGGQQVSSRAVRWVKRGDRILLLNMDYSIVADPGDEVARAHRYGRRLALVIFDLDDFKAINDRIGHLAGDGVLAEVAERVRAVVRSADVACRVGGDEFAIILPESTLAPDSGGRGLETDRRRGDAAALRGSSGTSVRR